MNLLFSKRQLINLAVVAAAVGANAFVAWTQIDGQREIDRRASQAVAIHHDLDRYRDALGSGVSALGRFAVQGRPESAAAHEARTASLDATARALRAELAGNAALAARFDALAAQGAAIAGEIDVTLARAGQRVADERGQAAVAAGASGTVAAQAVLVDGAASQEFGTAMPANAARSPAAPWGAREAAAKTIQAGSADARMAGHVVTGTILPLHPAADEAASAVTLDTLTVAPAVGSGAANGAQNPDTATAALPDPAAPSTVTAAWLAGEYIRLDNLVDQLDGQFASLQRAEELALAAALADSARSGGRALLLLIVTMLAGATLIIYTFGARESAAREKLRAVSGMRLRSERFQGLFDAHPVPMYVFDRETLRFLAVNTAAIQQYGYSEEEFLAMTIRDIRPAEDVSRLEQHLTRSDLLTQNVRMMAGIWHHRRRDGSIISADISHHSLTFLGRDAVFVLADDVTEQIKAEAEAQRSNQMLESVIDNIPQRIFWKDAQSRYLGCNMTFARDAGLSYPEQIIGKSDDDLPWRAYADGMREHDREVIESGLPRINYEDNHTIDGLHRTTLTSKLPLLDGDGRVIGVLGSYSDTTESKRADLALRLQSRALDACVNAILITAPGPGGSNLIEYANPAFRRITGFDPAEVIGQDCRFLQRDDRDQDGLIAVRKALLSNREVSAVLRNYRKDGALFWNQLLIAPVPDLDGRITHHIGIINDVTELIRYQEQLEYQANYDSLTLLPNRNLLRDRLQHALLAAQRHDTGVAVVFIDLDGFKNVNDSLGHSVGDRLLGVVAERLQRCTRTTDTVARHGGDEFVIVLTDTIDEKSLIGWMERARSLISEPVWIDGTELYVGCSMGASVYPQDGSDAETLMKKADVAMYRAKDMGRNTFQFFEPEMNANVGARLNLERRLRRALRDSEFLLHYQPQVEIEGGRIIGMEALVRWRDPEVGLVSPAQFIPVAEESGLIGPLSDWVLREACRQNRAWQLAGLPPVRVSVNFSAKTFHQRDIAQLVKDVLHETGLQACWLEIELTESTLMRNAEEAVSMLNELHALGIGIAIDDFGTGYSSLSYLKRLPVDRLKIDRSFVADIGTSSDDETITAAIIALAHELQLQVIAEGVETSAQFAFLRERACDELQGYFFAPPLPGDEAAALLRASATCEEAPGLAWTG
ncbi:EAL domain-containing protein [Paraburkholderia silvatlantica]|uniref:Diguanylate cyclase (GGDEF)-like protein/PAS domain S-box-containing protein n=1 Tax=Paraburkholderia silvatlantica TaxID=321895 RepID=A0A2U1AFA5_9BURK|nr:EAL domain-containing protein [Paraburkholderia silvatlantica]MBB2929615.1 diguanylate cyclase (GGDEF)-like protein/PAS domain S-box-containing protein [Paraburkholderia silvatlantica]PVY35085.1 PAS domain S-box-containing protein/diguanylate cyclase (GGDEF)-like protein [Paraburkholderia silvatlantica]PXW39495.1 PAS domain S-box-containing protein/diguanylate cyclase (GGDEF)-like protein [Paraburkholderia silvatlantica]PYE23348.1 PAS domain S-box-containing protein/diguanylate cyclase (GGDE